MTRDLTSMKKYAHLNANTVAMLALDDRARAKRMLVARFICHERIAPIVDYIDFLRHSPRPVRASGLVVTGMPGSGKTMLAKAMQLRYPPTPPAGSTAQQMPVAMINMTGAREAKHIYDRLLHELGCPDPSAYKGGDREQMAIKLCRKAELRMLLIDEIQDVLKSTARQHQIALDTIKFIMNELAISVVAFGIGSTEKALAIDGHLNARFEYRTLPVWKRDEFLIDFLAALEPYLPLKKASHLSSLPIVSALVERSRGGVLDRIVKLVGFAAAYAVETGVEQVTVQLIERAALEPPLWAVLKDEEAA